MQDKTEFDFIIELRFFFTSHEKLGTVRCINPFGCYCDQKHKWLETDEKLNILPDFHSFI